MIDQPTFNRRRVLELSGVGTGVAVAGCMDQVGTDGELADNERRGTFPLQIDQEAIQAEIEELQGQIEDDEITQEEAQETLSELEADLADDARADAQEAAESLGLTVENDVEIDGAQGIQLYMLVAGDAAALIDFIETESVQGLLPADVFAQIEAQQELQEEQGDEVPVEQTQ